MIENKNSDDIKMKTIAILSKIMNYYSL